MQEDDAFGKLLGDDVTPLNLEARVKLEDKDKSKLDEKSIQLRREKAQQEEKKSDPLAEDPLDMVEPLSIISFQRPGVQHGVMRNLRLGKYKLDAQLDLHKKGVERARKEVHQFVLDCVANDVRTAIITHGKGENREQPALLKSCVAHWLPQMKQVLAFHTAQKQHGGYGATYILLRKSDRKKQELREQYGRPDKG